MGRRTSGAVSRNPSPQFGNKTDGTESPPRLILDRPVAHLLLLCAIAVCIYSNTFHSPFLFDDRSSITHNRVIRDLGGFFADGSGFRFNPTRFVGYLSFALNYASGRLDVTGYHVLNLAIHVANAFLLYAFVLLLFRTPRMAGSALSGRARRVALFASALFVAHPVQTEAVTYIVQRLTSLSTAFYLASLLLYGQARLLLAEGAASRRKGAGLLLASAAFAVLAMHTKEISFTLPVAALMFDFAFFPKQPPRRRLPLAPLLLTLPIIPVHVLRAGSPTGGILSDVATVTSVQSTLPRADYLVTQLCVVATYIRLLFLPVNQTLDYDYPVYRALLAARPLLSLLLILGLLATAAVLYRRSRAGASPDLALPAFGILWFFLTLSVESSVIPIADVIFEHRLYLPSAGAFLAIASGGALLSRRASPGWKSRALAGGAMVSVAALSVATYARNEVYRDPVRLWEDAVRKSPAKARPYNNLGVELSAAERPADAVPVLEAAIRIEPLFADAYNNLAAALADSGRPAEAIGVLEKAMLLQPRHPQSYYNLGRIYLVYTGRYGDAIRYLAEAVHLKPDYADAWVNLAAAYNRSGRFADAVNASKAAIREAGGRADAHFNLCVAYASLGNADAARAELRIVRRLDPGMARQAESYLERVGAAR